MDILSFVSSGVGISDDGMAIPEVKALYDSDKKPKKPMFGSYMTGLYFMFSKQSPYSGLGESERIETVESRHLGMRKWKDMIKNEKFSAVVDLYKRIVMTDEEIQIRRQLEVLLKDIDQMIIILQGIPVVRKETVNVAYIDPGTKETTMGPVKIEMLNTKERQDAIKALKEMFNFQDYLRDRLEAKKTVAEKKVYVPLFDSSLN